MSLYQDIIKSFNKWMWKTVDFDWYYSNMCVDWVKQYAIDIGYPITTSGNAKWFATIWLWPNWRQVKEWQVGDIVVFPSGIYGHIAVLAKDVWIFLYVNEQNRDWKASATTTGSPISIWRYNWKWNEVFFRPYKKEIVWSKNIKARKDYDFKNYPILDQWMSWDCAWFAILGALLRMKDGVDYITIAKELIAEKWNELNMKSASEWFIKKGYIKWIRKASYSKPLMMRQPLITQLFNVNWTETSKAPYFLVYGGREKVWSHWVCISDWIIANSHGSDKYDKWYCYFSEEQRKVMKVFYTLEI